MPDLSLRQLREPGPRATWQYELMVRKTILTQCSVILYTIGLVLELTDPAAASC